MRLYLTTLLKKRWTSRTGLLGIKETVWGAQGGNIVADKKPCFSLRKGRTTLLIISLLIYQNSFSQYTDIINSNRPGNSSGAFSVGKNILQIESGFFNAKEKHDLLNYETKGFGIDFKIRYGFLYEKLELVISSILVTMTA